MVDADTMIPVAQRHHLQAQFKELSTANSASISQLSSQRLRGHSRRTKNLHHRRIATSAPQGMQYRCPGLKDQIEYPMELLRDDGKGNLLVKGSSHLRGLEA